MATCDWIFFSDTHLGKLKKLFPEDHLALALTEFRKPFEYAVKNGVKIVIHGGDVFDQPVIDHKYSKALIKLLMDYKQLKIYLLEGNHDFEDAENNSLHLLQLCCELGILPHVRIIQEKTLLKLEGIDFNFMPFPFVKFSKKPVINIAHTEVVGVRRDNNQLIRKGIELTNSSSLNFVGHIHKEQKVNEYTWFVGSLHQTNFGEQGAKGWYHVEVRFKTQLRAKVKFIKNNCAFQLLNLPITVQEDFTRIEKDAMTLYKLHLADGLSVPPKLTMKCPNVVSVVGFKGGEELALYSKQLPEEMYDGSSAILEEVGSDPVWGLLEFLKKEGLKKIQRKRALELVNSLLKID
jgi:DNA repair exonuclease SbcCD nuclease subunit